MSLLVSAVRQINCLGESWAGKVPLCKSGKPDCLQTRQFVTERKISTSDDVSLYFNKNTKFHLFGFIFLFCEICEVT